MKHKKYLIENFKMIANSSNFLLMLIILLVMNIFMSFSGIFTFDYFKGIYSTYTNMFYNLILFGVLLANTINTVKFFDRNLSYIIRFNNKKDYIKELLKNVVFSNTILYSLNFLLLFIFINIFLGNTISFTLWKNYTILNIVYITFYLLKSFILYQLLLFSIVCVQKLFNKIVMFLYSFLLVFPIIFHENKIQTIDSFKKMLLFPMDYLLKNEYANFTVELSQSLIYITFWTIFCYVIFDVLKRHVRSVEKEI